MIVVLYNIIVQKAGASLAFHEKHTSMLSLPLKMSFFISLASLNVDFSACHLFFFFFFDIIIVCHSHCRIHASSWPCAVFQDDTPVSFLDSFSCSKSDREEGDLMRANSYIRSFLLPFRYLLPDASQPTWCASSVRWNILELARATVLRGNLNKRVLPISSWDQMHLWCCVPPSHPGSMCRA